MALTPAQISRMRDGLKKAGWPDADTADETTLANKYLETAAADDFSAEIKTAIGGSAPGFAATGNDKAAKGFWNWIGGFTQIHKRMPTFPETQQLWGSFGTATLNYLNGRGGFPDEATFTTDIGRIAGNTPPSGMLGQAYASTDTLDQKKFDWQKDFDT